ncbi:MAG: DUF502 domain-containing protein [Chlamydiales bacterium]|nr:DUF502 domain-containing protein [Chlamydiales bacterium]
MLKKYFITGLVILLPLAVTIAIIGFLINFLTKPFVELVSSFFSYHQVVQNNFLFFTPDEVIRYGSQLLILVLLFFLTVFLGMVTRWFFITSLLRLSDKVLHRIPIVNTVYKTTQDIIKTLFVSDKKSFKQVVMVPFPHPGVYVLGLIARDAPATCSEKVGRDLISVLVPTTPNPTTGFLLMFPKEDLIYVDMKPEDAIKFIVSCGVIIPAELDPSLKSNFPPTSSRT